MLLKIVNVIMAYIIACLFIGLSISVTYYWSQIFGTATKFENQAFLQMFLAVSAVMGLVALPVFAVLGSFAYFKKIKSSAYYAFCWVSSVFLLIAMTEGLQSFKGKETGFWVPFFAFVAAAVAGYLFWFLAIRTPKHKIAQ